MKNYYISNKSTIVAVFIMMLLATLPVGAASISQSGTVPPEWDKSSIVLTGSCSNGEAVFHILNHGSDMQGESPWRLYVDNAQVDTGTFQLVAGEAIDVIFPLQGTSMRFEADQRPGHPGSSFPKVTIDTATCSTEPTATPVATVPEATATNTATPVNTVAPTPTSTVTVPAATETVVVVPSSTPSNIATPVDTVAPTATSTATTVASTATPTALPPAPTSTPTNTPEKVVHKLGGNITLPCANGEGTLQGATVTLSPGGYSTTVGTNGLFGFSDIPGGSYTVTVSINGLSQSFVNVETDHGYILSAGLLVSLCGQDEPDPTADRETDEPQSVFDWHDVYYVTENEFSLSCYFFGDTELSVLAHLQASDGSIRKVTWHSVNQPVLVSCYNAPNLSPLNETLIAVEFITDDDDIVVARPDFKRRVFLPSVSR